MVSCRALVTVIFPPGIIIKIKPDKIWEMTYNAGRVIWTPVVHLCIHDLSSKVDNLPCASNHYNKAVRDLQDNVQGGNELELDIAGGRTRYWRDLKTILTRETRGHAIPVILLPRHLAPNLPSVRSELTWGTWSRHPSALACDRSQRQVRCDSPRLKGCRRYTLWPPGGVFWVVFAGCSRNLQSTDMWSLSSF